jgi:hypothetical protein
MRVRGPHRMQPPQGPCSMHVVGVAAEPSPARACAWWTVRARRPARGPSRARGQPQRRLVGMRAGRRESCFSYLGIDWQPGRSSSGRTATRPRGDRDGPIDRTPRPRRRACGVGRPTAQVPLCCRLATAYLSSSTFDHSHQLEKGFGWTVSR